MSMAPPLPLVLLPEKVLLVTVSVPQQFALVAPPPSIVVSALIVFVLVTVIVAEPPQLKVTVPPPARQAFNAASVQLALAPVPATHASADEVTNVAKTSTARTGRHRVRAVGV